MTVSAKSTLIRNAFLKLSLSFFVSSAVYAQAQVVQGEYLVRYKMDLSSSNAIGKIQGKVTLKAAFPEMNMLHMALKPGQENVVNDLKNDPDVLYVEPNFILEKTDEGPTGQVLQTLSADEVYSQSSTSFSQNYSSVRVEQAWQLSKAYDSSNRPIVAILDTGVDGTHKVFKNSGALWTNLKEIPGNGVDDDQNGYIDDVNGWNFVSNSSVYADDEGHGTHVAGIVLGVGLDLFSSSIDPAKIQIMPLKFLDANGSGSTSNAIKAIYYAVNNGAQVINNSWGGPNYSSALLDALSYAYDHHVLVVSAAGNSAKNNDSTAMYPANYNIPSNISIAATTDTDKLASFSNYGVQSVHVASPGVYIYSSLPGNIFGSMSGTSMATPFVSGAAALALRESPALTGYQLKSLIISTADPINGLTGKVQTGARIDVYNLVAQAKSNPNATASQPDYKPSYSQQRDIASESSPSSSSSSGGGCGMVSTALLGKGMGGGNPFNPEALLVLISFLLPVIVYTYLRAKKQDPVNKRQHERFVMNSDISVNVGGRELVGHMKTISLGGLSFNAEEMLEKGGSLTIKIKGPDDKEIEVEGRVVWSESNNAYGVKFDEEKATFREAISNWTNKLVKSEN
ncbi:MAG: S8 family serine peptidase [Bdellovibrionales bacterium]|nr:S8 family serine peptidase [Bdellovibrionales bacterium]